MLRPELPIVLSSSQINFEKYATLCKTTLWRDKNGNESHWKGTVSKGFTKMKDGWKLIMHTGVLKY
ncbi:unnamed protein product [marine sediment metagenome]|uniref:SnoaL-like domain-containing protein n=1 Tax=marine sediment metagenome TaxID=412755 RepID=X0Z9P5_9ZZZZ